MDFFANLIRQPPVTDKHKRHDFSQYSDEFTITRQKGLRGFNDEVSEIEIGSQQINQDSINEIKNDQKLLLGQQESNKKMRMYQYDSKDESFDGQQFGLVDTDKSKKSQSKMIKVSLQSRLVTKQFPAPYQHVKGQQYQQQQQILTKQKNTNQNVQSNLSLPKSKKILSHMVLNLAELKKIKSQMKEYFLQQHANLKKLVEVIRYNLQIQIKRQFLAYANRQQTLITNNIKKGQKGQQIALKSKLKQLQELIKQMEKQLAQVCEENQTLQQKVFDMEQKMVGIDLQVQERFEKKKKQLQVKIVQDFLLKYNGNDNNNSNNQPQTNPHQQKCPTNYHHQQQHQHHNQQHNPYNLQQLLTQNQLLQQKLKSYQTILLQTDHIRKAKQQMQQLQFTLNERQQEILNKQKQAQKIFIQANKRSIDLEYTQDNLNKKLVQLKQRLRVKEEYLQNWEYQLNVKASKLSEKNFINFNNHSDNEDDDEFPTNLPTHSNYKIQALNFKHLNNNNNNQISSMINKNHPSQQDVFKKPIQQNTIKIQTSRHHKTQCSDDRPPSGNKIIYDPKKHQKYQQFDSNQRERYYMNNQSKLKDNTKTERLTSAKHIDLNNLVSNGRGSAQLNTNYNNNNNNNNNNNKSEIYSVSSKYITVSSHKIDVNNRTTNYLPTQIKKVNVDFYRPSSALNSQKYQPQYALKPPSSPINSNKTVRFDSYRNISPHHQRQGSVVSSTYNSNKNKSTISANNRLNTDYYRDRQQNYQPSNDRSTYSKSSMDNSVYSGHAKSVNRIAYQGYDMKKSKPKYEVTKLNDLGNKIDFLKSQLKSQIDNIL